MNAPIMSDDERAIREIMNDRAKALYAKNADKLFAHLAPEIVSFDLPPPLQFVGDAARSKEGFQAWFATWKGPIGWETRDVTVTVNGDLAFAYGLSHISGTKVDGPESKANGPHVDLWLRSTNCFCKTGGEWKIVHSHNSVPYLMDGSNKAAVDLKP
ncbi:MAG TPA: nuclear transport factor 2 family protein [Rhizomicrobium sp.]|nr:nuclear transport factor 2 family protein [Rhizomicrobium sp.]